MPRADSIPARRLSAASAFLLSVLGAALPLGAETLTWVPVEMAFLRVDDSAPKEWDVHQIEKKNDRFLVQLGGRCLFVDAAQKQVFELDSATIQREDSDLLWDPEDRPEKPEATSDWIVRDVGMALRIRMRLDSEGRTLDLQIPHPPSRP
jgi:hypothetical protein